MKQITHFLPRLYLPLLLLLVVAYAWRPLEGGYDFWAHSAVGSWIWSSGRVPRETLFLWSENAAWVAHSWLSQLLFYFLVSRGGVLGVAIFNVALPMAVFFLIWRLWKRQGEISFLTPLLFALAIWVSAPRYQPRQELISILFLTVLLAFLVAWSRGRFDDWTMRCDSFHFSLVAAPVVTLFFLWVNLHALVATGLLALWLAVIAEFLQAFFGEPKLRPLAIPRARALLAIVVLSTLATLLNPYGLAYWSAANPLKPGSLAQAVEEWMPLWQRPAMPWSYAIVELILFGSALLTWIYNHERRWLHLAWLLLGAALLLRSRRILWIAAVIFLVVLAANARVLDSQTLWRSWRRFTRGNLLEPIPPPMQLLVRSGVVVILLVWLLAAASRHTPREAGAWNVLVRNTPEGAVRIIRSGRLPRRIFNDYEDSSYLQWRLNSANPDGKRIPKQGRFPLYIDLLNAYPDRLMDEYLAILKASAQGIKYLKLRRIQCVVLGNHRWKHGLRKYLDKPGSGWKRVFQDKQSIIWVKTSAA